MRQILKRLELIKTAIDIDDEEIIELQVLKLQKLGIDDNVKTILEKLENMNYAKAVQKIEDYLVKYSGVVEYVDSEVQGLKLELKALESKLQKLIEQKIECLNDIEEFSREYNLHLGEILKDILNLKKEILYKKTIKQQQAKERHEEERQTCKDIKETIDELKATMVELEDALENIDEDDENYEELTKAYDELKEELERLEDELEFQEEELEKTKEFIEDETVEQEYEEVKSHYEEFEDEYEQIKKSFENSITLNDEEKQELKSFYKKAARLCHPDIVPDELKEKAHELMQKLNDAYSQKDISQVKEILYSLQNGTSFEVSSETIEDKELLKAKIKEYLKNIEALKSELEEIKEDEIYQTIDMLDDWDEYFEEMKSALEEEMQTLKGQLEGTLEDRVESEEDKSLHVETQNAYDEIQKKIEELEEFLEDMDEDDERYEEISQVYEELKESLKELEDELENQKDTTEENPKAKPKKENSSYSKSLLAIEQPTFEKIRRCCSNLKNDDALSTYLAQNGKMHKALIYSALEEFLEDLEGESLTLIDWGCGQGLASMLVLNYIKEKQLDIQVSNVMLIDDNTKALSRAMVQVEALAQNSMETTAIKSDDNILYDKINTKKKHTILHLFANDKIPIAFTNIDDNILDNDFILFISNKNREFVENSYRDFNFFMDVEDISIQDGKIGRFSKYERIFKARQNIPTIDIDDDEIAF